MRQIRHGKCAKQGWGSYIVWAKIHVFRKTPGSSNLKWAYGIITVYYWGIRVHVCMYWGLQNNWDSPDSFQLFSSSKLVQKSVENRWANTNYFAISSTGINQLMWEFSNGFPVSNWYQKQLKAVSWPSIVMRMAIPVLFFSLQVFTLYLGVRAALRSFGWFVVLKIKLRERERERELERNRTVTVAVTVTLMLLHMMKVC
jgi:hypothetical protein